MRHLKKKLAAARKNLEGSSQSSESADETNKMKEEEDILPIEVKQEDVKMTKEEERNEMNATKAEDVNVEEAKIEMNGRTRGTRSNTRSSLAEQNHVDRFSNHRHSNESKAIKGGTSA